MDDVSCEIGTVPPSSISADTDNSNSEETVLSEVLQKLTFDEFSKLEKDFFGDEEHCTCKSCRVRRSWDTDTADDLKLVQAYWLELRQYIRLVYKVSMKNALHSVDINYHNYMKGVVSRLYDICDPHQLYRKLKTQVNEFISEIKLRLLQLLERLAGNPKLPLLFISAMLDRYYKLMNAATEVTPTLIRLEVEHLSKFNLTWKILNQKLFQTRIYTDSFFQNSVPLFITQLQKICESEESKAVVHAFMKFDCEAALIENNWKSISSNLEQYLFDDSSVESNGSRRDILEQMNIHPEEPCECRFCLDLLSTPASVELMDQFFSPGMNGETFNETSSGMAEVCDAGECSVTTLLEEELQAQTTPQNVPKRTIKECLDFFMGKQGGLQKRVDKATQKDQEVQSFEAESSKTMLKKKPTDNKISKNYESEPHCNHFCNHSKHVEKIKRVTCIEKNDGCYPDHSKHDVSTDSKQQCDCCYCEVFGLPSTAPMSRNYMEMRERLRFILSKKRTNCKGSTVPLESATSTNSKRGSKKETSQCISDSNSLQEILNYIEGTETNKCRNEKKAAKKARQKEKKVQMLKQKEEEEKAERLYKEALAEAELEKANLNLKERREIQISSKKKGKNKLHDSKICGEPETSPQMVTIKRIMDSNSAEPTVTITLRGATPKQDRVLYTLLNGQVCEVKESKTSTTQNNMQNQKRSQRMKNVKVSPLVNSELSSSTEPSTDNETEKKGKQKKDDRRNKSSGKINESEINIEKTMQKQNGLTNPTAIQINNVVNKMSKAEQQKCFKIEDLKLPPGITITKVDPNSVKPKMSIKEDTGNRQMSSSPQMRSSSEVIVVATGHFQDKVNQKDFNQTDLQSSSTPSKKKKNKKKVESNNNSNLKITLNGIESVYLPTDVVPTIEKIGKSRNTVMSLNATPNHKINRKHDPEINVANSDFYENKKKNKKKQKNDSIYNINSEELRLLDSVFAPKDIDLENGDIDDAERELEAFKRFCSQSVPPKRKEKVHLNIKDIILKKKSLE